MPTSGLTLVVVGASYAGAQVAAAARQSGFAGKIQLLGDEADLPYQRPPLSKAYLTGGAAEASLPLRSEVYYREQNIEVLPGVRVTAIDRAARQVTCADGRRYGYDWLALATGARPRPLPLPGATLEGVLELRTLADARKLKARLADAQRVIVVGGGFIGLEAASAAATLGKQVMVLEAAPRLLARACTQGISDYVAQLHKRNGVDIVTGAQVVSILGQNGRVRGVALAGGAERAADLVLVGIGVLPNVELAQAAGLDCSDGIVVDRFARTSDPRIVAAGDCTRFPSPWAASPVRLESVQNANDQARTAAATVCGREVPHESVPWFWSDQYDMRLQMAGLPAGFDAQAVRGAVEEGKFSIFYLRGGRIAGADSVSRAGDHMMARKLIAAGATATVEQLRDPAFDLKALLPK